MRISGKEIGEWIDDLGFDSPHTFNTYRKIIRSFYEHFRKYVARNPCDDLKPRDDRTEHVGILTVKQTEQLFSYALQFCPEVLGRLALEAFAGLRFSSAFRLE